MRDNPLIALLIATIQTGLTAQGVTVGIQQSQQPEQQGAPSSPCILISKIGDSRYGSPQRTDVYVSPGVTAHTETDLIETTYQVDAIATQDPANTTQLTAADYVKIAARILQSEAAIVSLIANGVGILRITKIRQNYFKDERHQNESAPSFDFTVSHTDSVTTNIPSTLDIVEVIQAVT